MAVLAPKRELGGSATHARSLRSPEVSRRAKSALLEVCDSSLRRKFLENGKSAGPTLTPSPSRLLLYPLQRRPEYGKYGEILGPTGTLFHFNEPPEG
jgi:hypothetical protein